MKRYAKSRQYEQEEFIDVEKEKKGKLLGQFFKINFAGMRKQFFYVTKAASTFMKKNEDTKAHEKLLLIKITEINIRSGGFLYLLPG